MVIEMAKTIIYTENPETEMWRKLLQFSYKSQIESFFRKREIQPTGPIDELSEIVSSSLLQAKDYFDLSTKSSLYTSPLLLYYGSINLINAVYTLLNGKKSNIQNHGLRVDLKNIKNIGDNSIHFFGEQTGGLSAFSSFFEPDLNFQELGDWTIKEMLLSCPDVFDEALNCYQGEEPYCYRIDKALGENGTFRRIVFANKTKEQVNDIFDSIPNYNQNYIKPQLDENDGFIVAIINKKYLADDIEIESIYGQPFFQRGHTRQNKSLVLPQWIYYYSILYGLSFLCRYKPDVWSPFVRLDQSGEKLLIEKFLDCTRRIIPNHFLSILLEKNIIFENKRFQPRSIVKTLNEHEIKEIIKREIVRNGNK